MIQRLVLNHRLCWRLNVVLIRNQSHHAVREFNRSKHFSTSSLLDENQLFLKEILYPNSNDPVIQQINQCATVEELLKTRENLTDKSHLLHFIVMIWDHTKSPNKKIDLFKIAEDLSKFHNEMSADELSSSLMYLNKLGLSIKDPHMQSLIQKILQLIDNKNDDEMAMTALSRFTVILNSDHGLYSQLIAVKCLPLIIKNVENCENAEDLYLLTICLNNIHRVVSKTVIDKFKQKVSLFLDQDILDESSPKVVFKIINLLNYPHWSADNAVIIRRLLMTLEPIIKTLNSRELMVISKAFQSHLESAKLIPLIVDRSKKLLEEAPNVELLSLAVLYSTPEQRTKVANLVRDFVFSYQIKSDEGNLENVYRVLRLLKISDTSLCDSYWTKTINDIYITRQDELRFKLNRQMHRYMFFNNNLGGTYRHLEFEKSINEIAISELRSGFASIIPSDFIKHSAFVIAYGDYRGQIIPKFIIAKIEEIQDQLSLLDMITLSRGLEILFEMRFRKLPNELKEQIKTLHQILNKCAIRHMASPNLSLSEMNAIIRSYTIRRGTRDTQLFHDMIKYYDRAEKFQLNSRSIREIVYNLTACNFRMDSICEQFVDYILGNYEHVTGETVEKVS